MMAALDNLQPVTTLKGEELLPAISGQPRPPRCQ
jgi:hypothetical protein